MERRREGVEVGGGPDVRGDVVGGEVLFSFNCHPHFDFVLRWTFHLYLVQCMWLQHTQRLIVYFNCTRNSILIYLVYNHNRARVGNRQ